MNEAGDDPAELLFESLVVMLSDSELLSFVFAFAHSRICHYDSYVVYCICGNRNVYCPD